MYDGPEEVFLRDFLGVFFVLFFCGFFVVT
jgi:hypothetical protein